MWLWQGVEWCDRLAAGCSGSCFFGMCLSLADLLSCLSRKCRHCVVIRQVVTFTTLPAAVCVVICCLHLVFSEVTYLGWEPNVKCLPCVHGVKAEPMNQITALLSCKMWTVNAPKHRHGLHT